MVLNKDKSTNDEVIIRKGRNYYSKRNHIFTKRVNKFCFCWKKVSWRKGLLIIAIMTIIFGIIEYLIFNLVALRGEPSAVPAYILFPYFSKLVNFEFCFFISLGIMLLVGVCLGNLGVIKCFPWLLLFGYIFAAFFIITLILDGEQIVHALVWSDHGMLIKSDLKKEKKALLIQQVSFYIIISFLILALIFFTTYIIILTLSWIDKLELEIWN